MRLVAILIASLVGCTPAAILEDTGGPEDTDTDGPDTDGPDTDGPDTDGGDTDDGDTDDDTDEDDTDDTDTGPVGLAIDGWPAPVPETGACYDATVIATDPTATHLVSVILDGPGRISHSLGGAYHAVLSLPRDAGAVVQVGSGLTRNFCVGNPTTYDPDVLRTYEIVSGTLTVDVISEPGATEASPIGTATVLLEDAAFVATDGSGSTATIDALEIAGVAIGFNPL